MIFNLSNCEILFKDIVFIAIKSKNKFLMGLEFFSQGVPENIIL